MVALVNFDIKERQPREQPTGVKREDIGTPRAVNIDLDKNFKQRLMQLGSTVKDRSESHTAGQMPETGLYRDTYDIHTYDNQFHIESSIKRMMDDADRLAQEGAPHMDDRYFMEPNMPILTDRAMEIKGLENQMNELMNITPEKLHKFEAEFKGESQTKRKAEIRDQQRQIDENLEARIERVIEGYEKLGEMKMTIDKVLSTIMGDQNAREVLEQFADVDTDAKEILNILEGKAHDAESRLNSRKQHRRDESALQHAGRGC